MGRNLDESVDRVLRGSFKASASGEVSGECLDAETLAAWTDGGLSAADRTIAESHLSTCRRCQAMLAIVIQTSPVETPSESWWQRVRGWPWLVPITAGTAAIVIWVAIQNGPSPAVVQQPATPSREQAEAQQERGPQSAPTPVTPDTKEQMLAREERANTPDLHRDQPSGGARDEVAAAQTAAPADRLGQVAEKVSPDTSTPVASTRAAATAAAPPAAPAQALESPAAARRLNEGVAQFRQSAGQLIVVVSPDPLIRWGVGRSGTIQFSTNGGSTWETLSSGVMTDLVAGASPSTAVCWVVGQAGTVLLAIDGRRFQRLPFSESVDLVAVRATDARAAIVTTTDKRSFRTSNGGQTWVQTPLQEF